MSLYRKYRPQTFEDLVGQDHISQTLRNALSANPLRVAHAYLFVGPRGTGKTTSARLLAKCLNCEQGPTPNPCNKCDFCVRVSNNQITMDLIEMDAASNRGIDDARDINAKVNRAPAQGGYRIYIIDEAHQLTIDAFNALLKTLEEPPEHAIFVLATTSADKMPKTVASRCQRFDFRRVGPNDIIGRLMYVAESEGLKLHLDAARLIAQTADGALRDALTLLEQVSAFAAEEINESDVRIVLGTVSRELLLGLMDAVAQKDATSALRQVEQATEEGVSFSQLTRDLTAYCRDLLLLTVGFDDNVAISDAERARRQTHAQQIGRERLTRSVEMLRLAEKEMRESTDHRLLLELTLVRLTAEIEYSISSAPSANAPRNAPIPANAPANQNPTQPIWKQPTIAAKAQNDANLGAQNRNAPQNQRAESQPNFTENRRSNRDENPDFNANANSNDAQSPLENAARLVESNATPRISNSQNIETCDNAAQNSEFQNDESRKLDAPNSEVRSSGNRDGETQDANARDSESGNLNVRGDENLNDAQNGATPTMSLVPPKSSTRNQAQNAADASESEIVMPDADIADDYPIRERAESDSAVDENSSGENVANVNRENADDANRKRADNAEDFDVARANREIANRENRSDESSAEDISAHAESANDVNANRENANAADEIRGRESEISRDESANVARDSIAEGAAEVVESAPTVASPSRKKGRRIHNLEELIELWPAVLARVKRKIGVTAVAYLHDAQPVAMDEKTATIEFQKEFHYAKAREAAGRLPFEDVLNECMAEPHILKFLWNPPRSKAAPVEDVPPPPDDDDDEDDVVRLAQDMFGAEVVGRSGEV